MTLTAKRHRIDLKPGCPRLWPCKALGHSVVVWFSALLLTGCINNPKYAAMPESPQAGQKAPLQVKPGKVTTASVPVRTPVSSVKAGAKQWYTVEKGDTLYSIAMRFDLDYRGLAASNNISDNYHLSIGQRIELVDQPVGVSATDQVRAGVTVGSPSGQDAGVTREYSNNQSASVSPSLSQPIIWQWPVNRNIVKTDKSITPQLKGVDIAGRMGETIVAAAPGVVVFAGSGLRGYGNMVIVQHSGNYLSAYAYANEILVKEQQEVAAGDPVARMGQANVTADPALHFEIRKDGKPLNPLSFLP